MAAEGRVGDSGSIAKEMNASLVPARSEFYFRRPDNLILVENGDGGVLIRAAHDNFSERRKALFIRELATEGFIPEQFRWFADADSSPPLGVRWVIDSSWVRLYRSECRGAIARLVRIYIVATLSWFALMITVLKFAGARF